MRYNNVSIGCKIFYIMVILLGIAMVVSGENIEVGLHIIMIGMLGAIFDTFLDVLFFRHKRRFANQGQDAVGGKK